MDRGKLESAALVLTVLGALAILPPLALLFQLERRLFGIPLEVIYLFVCWAGLIGGAYWLSTRLGTPGASPPKDDS